MSTTTKFLIVLRGAFPYVTPKETYREFSDVMKAQEWALEQCRISCAGPVAKPGYTRFTVHEVGPWGRAGQAVFDWVAGE